MTKKLRTEEVMRYKIRKGDRVSITYMRVKGTVIRRFRSGEVLVEWDSVMHPTALVHNPNYLDKKRYSEWVPGR
jgi:hypothetical protein